MTEIVYRFVPMGTVAKPASGRVYLDVGNSLVPGVIDHHQPDAPELCTSALVLDQPRLVTAQVAGLGSGEPMEVVTHFFPDMDAITAVHFTAMLLSGRRPGAGARRWAGYVCDVDRGLTRLDPNRPLTAYALFLARMELVAQAGDAADRTAVSVRVLDAGRALIDWLLAGIDAGAEPDALAEAAGADPTFAAEVELIYADLARYRLDLQRAERFVVPLPKATGGGREQAPGLWIRQPDAVLFKAWARGDQAGAEDERGFVFTAVELSGERSILSVMPDSGLWLYGLGERLEEAETDKRRRLGRERRGEPRPGYVSPDPWYDGRSPLHNFTIIDAPHGGTLLSGREIRGIFDAWLKRPDGQTSL